MNYTVRQATTADIPGLMKLMNEYIVDFYQFRQPADEQLAALIELLLEGREGIQFVAEAEGQSLIGFVTLYFTFSTLRASRVVVMNDLYVQEAYHGSGVAAGLFNACKAYTASHGYANMSWSTAQDNYRAQRFYAKMGGEQDSWISYSIDPAR
jgi:ribosomal protein S18 acetylase RimI-like enzyme